MQNETNSKLSDEEMPMEDELIERATRLYRKGGGRDRIEAADCQLVDDRLYLKRNDEIVAVYEVTRGKNGNACLVELDESECEHPDDLPSNRPD